MEVLEQLGLLDLRAIAVDLPDEVVRVEGDRGDLQTSELLLTELKAYYLVELLLFVGCDLLLEFFLGLNGGGLSRCFHRCSSFLEEFDLLLSGEVLEDCWVIAELFHEGFVVRHELVHSEHDGKLLL